MSVIKRLLAKGLRLPISLLPAGTVVRILRGPLRGKKWVLGSGPNAYWAGTYEIDQLRALEDAVSQGAVFYDIGANVGIYALLASIRVGPDGTVYCFEPLRRNLKYLRHHVKINNLQNCVILEMAVCDREGVLPFSAASFSPSMPRLSPTGEIAVPCTTLDACVLSRLICTYTCSLESLPRMIVSSSSSA